MLKLISSIVYGQNQLCEIVSAERDEYRIKFGSLSIPRTGEVWISI